MNEYGFTYLRDSRSAWMQHAACRGSEIDFFPERMSDIAAALAVAICNRCPVQDACTRYSIVNDIEYGVWGGLSPRARREIKSSATVRDRNREKQTFDRYTQHKNAGRTDPVKSTSRDLNISTATVYHHIRIIKFKTLLESWAIDDRRG